MEDTSEFLLRYVAFAENVMILEEVKQSHAVFLNHILNFPNECSVFSFSVEIDVFFNVGRFCSSCWSIDDVFQAVCILEEFGVHDFIVLIAIYLCDIFSIIV